MDYTNKISRKNVSGPGLKPWTSFALHVMVAHLPREKEMAGLKSHSWQKIFS